MTSNSSCSISLAPALPLVATHAFVADALQALGHGLGVERLVVDDQDLQALAGLPTR